MDTDPRRTRRLATLALAATVAGLAIRLWLAAATVGTNDILTWFRFAAEIETLGLARSYEIDPELIHPPLPALWSWAAAQIGGFDPNSQFPTILKLPAIFADVATGLLLWRIGLRTGGPALGATLAAAMAFNPLAILVSGYHGNTDNVYVFFVLLAFDAARRNRWALAGLALGAAINVKLIPAMLIPVVLAGTRSWRGAGRAVGGLAVMAVPFLLATIATQGVFLKKVLTYGSNAEAWGIPLILSHLDGTGPGVTEVIGVPVDPALVKKITQPGPRAGWYHHRAGRWILLGAIVLTAAWARWRRVDAVLAAGVASALFVVLAPGFGIQYLVLPAVLALAVSVRWGVFLGASGGLFAGFVYYSFLDGSGDLWYSRFWGPYLPPATNLGLATWGLLLLFVAWAVARGRAAAAVRPAPTEEH